MAGSNGSNVKRENGNTNRSHASKNWCFTWNNYTLEDIDFLICLFGSDGSKYIFQEEVGESGTPHLQGFVSFKTKRRPIEYVKKKDIHWEKTRSVKHSIAYCSKSDSRSGKIFANMPYPEPIRCIKVLRPWQKDIENILLSEVCDRAIYWFYDKKGGVGKTAFTKYCVLKYHAIILNGSRADMQYGIVKYIEKHSAPPKIVIMDFPRSQESFSWTGIESIKNGMFFNTKYESDMVVFNPPHLICFANCKPDLSKLSQDRWVIKKIKT